MTNAEKYAQKLQRDYGIEQVAVSLDDETYDTADKVATEVLPAETYQQWRKDYAAEVNAMMNQHMHATQKAGA